MVTDNSSIDDLPEGEDDDENESTDVNMLPILPPELRPEEKTAYLVVLAGANVGQMYKLADVETVIGRAEGNQIRLTDNGVSRRHARFVAQRGQIVIEDLQSANGTLVNGQKIDQRTLNDGDKIRIGSTTMLKFTYQDKLDESFQQQMYDAALRDGLTGAFNKKYLIDRLETEFAYAQRHKTMLSLVMLDVDHFKRVNDTHGHLAGDEVLIRLAELVQKLCRAEDVVARYGGEEFSIICRGIPLINTAVLAERLRGGVEQAAISYGEIRLPITISLGVAAFSETPAENATELIAAADAALYDAKHGGRNRVCIKRN